MLLDTEADDLVKIFDEPRGAVSRPSNKFKTDASRKVLRVSNSKGGKKTTKYNQQANMKALTKSTKS